MIETKRSFYIGIDIGGTCTDCVVLDSEGDITLGKVLSTPPHFIPGIIASIASAASKMDLTTDELLSASDILLHSTTAAENALVDGTVAKTGLLTTAGFERTLWATRGGYGRWFGLNDDELKDPVRTDKGDTIVPLELIEGVAERTDSHGNALKDLDLDEVRQSLARLRDEQIDALAICLLWSFANGENERLAAREAAELMPQLFISISSDVAPTIGEYERTSTTALNAMLGAVIQDYLTDLQRELYAHGFNGSVLVMQAYGGLAEIEHSIKRPVGLIESGPVAGLNGSARLGAMLGHQNVISADMGGTTFKVGIVREGLIDYQRESAVLRHHLSVPKLDIISMGIAGGSIISIDAETNLPAIGPNSAGSYPGPICYQNGGEEPTITDVDGILGFLSSQHFLDGSHKLDIEKAHTIFGDAVAGPLDLATEDAAAAIYRLANSLIFDFLHKTTVQRGLDPREFALFSTGGTAGMHLPTVAHQLGVAEVVVPHSASVHGAYGLVTSDIAVESLSTQPMRYGVDSAKVREIMLDLSSDVVSRLQSVDADEPAGQLEWMVDMRFSKQVHILTVPVWSGSVVDPPILDDSTLGLAVDLFEHMYVSRYGPGSAYRDAGIELVAFRVRGSQPLSFRPSAIKISELVPPPDPIETRRSFDPSTNQFAPIPCFGFDDLLPGASVSGPAIIWSPITTIVIGSAQRLRVDETNNLRLTARDQAT